MKGYTKGKGAGRKFIPTNNKKQGLKKSDIRKKQTIGVKEINSIVAKKSLDKPRYKVIDLKHRGDDSYEKEFDNFDDAVGHARGRQVFNLNDPNDVRRMNNDLKRVGKDEYREKESLDDNIQIPDIPVSSSFRVIDDSTKDHKFLEPIRFDAKPFEDYDIEKQVKKALTELKKRGIVDKDAYAKFDDNGWEGGQLDVYIIQDDDDGKADENFKGIRLSMEAWVDYDGDEQEGVEELISDKLIDQFNDNQLYNGRVE